MSGKAQLNQENCESNKWEFYKTTEGLWCWRAIAPEGWDQEKGEWSKNSNWHGKSNWKENDWNHEGINWIEVARSQEGYKSKSDCEDNARKHGWK